MGELTECEMSVLLRLVAGDRRKQIADYLSVSENTVKSHLRNIYQKLAVIDAKQAVAWYYQHKDELEQGVVSNTSPPLSPPAKKLRKSKKDHPYG